MVILDLEVLGIISKKIVGNIQHQKDVQRNSVQKEVLNSSPSFFSASLVKKTLIIITSQEHVCGLCNWLRWVRKGVGVTVFACHCTPIDSKKRFGSGFGSDRY